MTYENWLYYQDREIIGSPDKILTDHEVEYTIDYNPNKMKSDFGDIRFSIGGTPCQYYEKEKVDSDYCIFIVKIPEIPLNPESIIVRIHSGNNGAVSESTKEAYTFLGRPDNEDWLLNDATFAHIGDYNNSAKFDTVNNKLALLDKTNYSGGNAKAKKTVLDGFHIQYNTNRYYDGMVFIFYFLDLNNYMAAIVQKRTSFGHYLKIIKVVNGTTTELATTYNNPYEGEWNGIVDIKVSDNLIEVYYNNTLKINYNGSYPKAGNAFGFNAWSGGWAANLSYAYLIGEVILRKYVINAPTVEPASDWLNFSSYLDYKTEAIIPHNPKFRTVYCIRSIRNDTQTIFNIRGLKTKLIRLICGTRTVYAVRTAVEYPIQFTIPANTPATDIETTFMVNGFMVKTVLVRGWITYDPLGLPGVDENVTEPAEDEPITEKIENDETITVLVGDHTYV